MATYIPQITDVFPEPYIYKPDLAFFDKMLQRKTALYEQGIAKSRSAFEAVLNAPLSNKENIPIRDAYIRQARLNLQKMAGLDFSQAQNVAAARNIFSPFWEDKFIVKDTELTRHYQNQAQILDGWKNSDDPKIRENYSGIAAQDLQDGLDVLINATRTDEDFSKVEKRKATPFTNIEKFLQEAASKDKEGLKIVWDETSPDGAYLVRIDNGERSKKPFAIWAQSQIGNNFYEQFRVTGRVYKQELYRQYKKINPNATDEEINSKIADEHIKEIDLGFTKRKNQILTEIARIDGIVNALPKVSTPAQEQLVAAYASERAQLYGRLNQISEEYKLDITKDYKDQIRTNILRDPDGYFGTLSKQRTIDNWATGRSVITSRELKTNEPFFKAQEIAIKKAEYNLDLLKTENQFKNDELNRRKTESEIRENEANTQKILNDIKTGKTSIPDGYKMNSNGQLVDQDGNIVTNVAGVVAGTGARYTGPGVYDVVKEGTASEVFEKNQKTLFNSSYELTFSNDGLLYFAKKGLNLSDADIAAISSHYSSQLRSDLFVPGGAKHDIKNDPRLKNQKAAVDKLANLLLSSQYVKDAGIKEITYGPGTMHNALKAYVNGYLKDRADVSQKNGVDFTLDDQEFKAFTNYSVAMSNMERYLANEENRTKIITDYAKNNSVDANKYFNKKDDGTYEFLTPATFAQTKEAQAVAGLDAKIIYDLPLADAVARGMSKGLNWLGIPANLNNNLAFGQTYLDIKINPKALAESMMSGNFQWNAVQEITPGGAPANSVSVTIKDYNKSGETVTFYMQDPTKSYNALDAFSSKFGTDSSKYAQEYKKIYDNVVPNLQYFAGKTAKQGAEFTVSFSKDKQGNQDMAYVLLDEALNQGNATMYYRNEDGITDADDKVVNAIKGALKGKESEMEEFLKSFTYTTVGSKEFGTKPYISFRFKAIPGQSELKVGDQLLTDLAAKGEFILAINEGSNAPNLQKLPRNTGFYIYQSLLDGKQIKSDPLMERTGFTYALTPNRDGTNPNDPPTSVRLNLKFMERRNTETTDPATGKKTLKSELVEVVREDIDFPFTGENSKTPDEIVLEMKRLYQEVLNNNKRLQDVYTNWLKTNTQYPQTNSLYNQLKLQ
jgi:hypothetical protein